MKIQKWTLGLAALGLVTLSPALLAQDAIAQQLVPVQTALSATTISGYVDTSAVWNPGTGNANPAPYAFNAGKQDGFNLDAIDLKIAKALDEGQWSAGYTFELSYGPDAEAIDGSAYPIRQAYVTMRTPVGNGIDWQLGRWDSIIGYESSDSYKNPNYTRSYGYTFEPTEHTGLLASYKFCDAVSLQVGVADTVATGSVNARTDGYYGKYYESKKALVSAVTLTAPESWGSFAGSKLYAGFDLGQGGSSEGFRTSGTTTDTTFSVKPHNRVRTEWYVGTTINTPVKGLTFGASWDGIEHNDVNWDGDAYDTGYFQSFAGYASYKATDKLTISGRVEYASGSALGLAADENNNYYYEDYNPLNKVLAVTGTIQYDLWANVISRLEIRWDHAANGADAFGGSSYSYYDESYYNKPDKRNEVMVAANVIYKF